MRQIRTAKSAKVDLETRRTSKIRVRRLVLRKVKQEEGVTLRDSGRKLRRSRFVASPFVLERRT